MAAAKSFLILLITAVALYAYEPQFSISDSVIDQNFRNLAAEVKELTDYIVTEDQVVEISTAASVSGYFQFASKTAAQLVATVPTAAGQAYFCSDCSPAKIVVSTGTAAGNFAAADGGAFE